MEDMSLIAICGTAFSAVFFLLLLLAAVMRLIQVVFPYDESKEAVKTVPRTASVSTGAVDSAIIAAIGAVTAAAYPGAKITNIREIK